MNTGIYQIKNIVNGTRYIGSAISVKDRLLLHKWQLNKSSHYNKHLQFAWNKYGPESFEFQIVEYCEPIDLITLEQIWINKYVWTSLYNICPNAGNNLGRYHSESTKEKCRLAKIGNRSRLGLPHTLETRVKIGIGNQKEYSLINPSGDVVHIVNLSKFCLENNLAVTNFYKLFKGKWKQYKGWTLCEA